MDAETPAEQGLLKFGVSGTVLSFKELAGADRVVRAEFIRELVLQTEDGDPRGLGIDGIRVLGSLDLAFVTCRWPLSFSHTTFDERVVIERARLPRLQISDSILA